MDRQDPLSRARLAERVRARAVGLMREGSAPAEGVEDAAALALFLEFAEHKGVSAAEAASLLEDPGSASVTAYRRMNAARAPGRGAGAAAARSRAAERGQGRAPRRPGG